MRFIAYILICLCSLNASAQPVMGIPLALKTSASNPYTHSYSIVTDYTQCGTANSTDFVLTLSYTVAALKTTANGGSVNNTTTFNGRTVPADVVFASDAAYTTLLSWSVIEYSATGGSILVKIKIPTLSYTANTTIYMGVGAAATTTYQGGSRGAAFSSDYKLYWSLGDGTTLNATDETSNALDGTITGATATTGVVGGAAAFNGTSSQYINASDASFPSGNGSRTMGCWMKIASSTSFNNIMYYGKGNSKQGSGMFLYNTSNSDMFWTFYAHDFDAGTPNVKNNAWHYVVTTYDGTTLRPYVDGAAGTTGTPSGVNTTLDHFRIGYSNLQAFITNGSIDECWVSNAVKTASTILAEYNNQKASSTFLTVTNIY